MASRDDYNELAIALRGQGLGWIVEQVEEAIAIGNLRIARRSTRHVDDAPEIVRSAALGYEQIRPAEIIVPEPYTDVERLQLLLDAVRRAIIDISKTELSTLELLQPDVDVVAFADDAIDSKINYATSLQIAEKHVVATNPLAERLQSAHSETL